jgi:hypothetical protein
VHNGYAPLADPLEQTNAVTGPSYVEVGGRELLYFSRSSVTPSVAGGIFVSGRLAGDGFGPASAVTALNDAIANDIQPNVRKDGLEIVFSSNRAGGLGLQDIWVATRRTVHHSWAPPLNLGPAVNTAASETRPSLSWRAEQLLFGRSPGHEGMSDIYVTTREKVKDDDDCGCHPYGRGGKEPPRPTSSYVSAGSRVCRRDAP